uniref:Uncharacterized protein n=1 Tax=Globodera rostochiensis TaxID=31243 RepID=A0A914I7M5_GLORO
MDSKFVVIAFALITALILPGLSWGDDSASAPEVLTPCEKMMAKCRGNWGECFPRDGYKGDACCEKGSSWKCNEDMTIDELILKNPAIAKMMNCFLAGHPDLIALRFFNLIFQNCFFGDSAPVGVPDFKSAKNESLKKCMPHPSECKGCDVEPDWNQLDKCPRKFKCLQRKHSDIYALAKCMPKKPETKEECNAPLPPIENSIEA